MNDPGRTASPRRDDRRAAARVVGLGALLALTAGCPPKGDTTGSGADPVAVPTITYAELAAKHNARVAPIRQVWARAVVEVEWTDADGRDHYEQGDGPFIARRPADLALAIGKLGNTRFWLGADRQRYWFFDLAGEQRLAYVGRHDRAPLAADHAPPLPIRPDQLHHLLGINPLPPPGAEADADLNPRVTRDTDADQWRIALPVDDRHEGWAWHIHVDDRYRIRRFTLLDDEGAVVLTATHSRFQRLELEGQPPGAFPELAHRIEIRLPNDRATATLLLSDAGDRPDRIRDVQFDFDRLIRLQRIDRVIDLDQRPADAAQGAGRAGRADDAGEATP